MPSADSISDAPPFLLTAIVPLLALPGFLVLRPEDGIQVSGHRAVATARPDPETA